MKWGGRALIQNPIKLGLCLDEKEYLREMRIHGVNNPSPFIVTSHGSATAHFFTTKNERIVIVCLRVDDNLDGIQIASLLVHEAVHIWQDIKELIGEHSPSIEFEAYSIQSISQELMDLYVDICFPKKK